MKGGENGSKDSSKGAKKVLGKQYFRVKSNKCPGMGSLNPSLQEFRNLSNNREKLTGGVWEKKAYNQRGPSERGGLYVSVRDWGEEDRPSRI